MNTNLLERLRSFQIPPTTPLSEGNHVVARLQGVEYEGIIDSPEFGFEQPFDARFGKMMVRTASHLLGGDVCGHFGYVEQLEFSMLMDFRTLTSRWTDASDLQSFLVALASSKMSLQVEDEALFTCNLYSFANADLVIAYFMWRQQEAYVTALNRYCIYVLSKESSPETVANILEGLGPLEKEEILRQNGIEYSEVPAWQRRGAGVSLASDNRVSVEANLPEDSAYRPFLQQFLG